MEQFQDIAVDNLYQKQKIFFKNQLTKSTSFRVQKLKTLKKEIQKLFISA